MAAPGPTPPVRGMIFDLDGTIADTLDICVVAFQDTIAAHGGPALSRTEVVSLFGPTESGVLRNVLGDDWRPALGTYLVRYAELHAECPLPFPGMFELLAELEQLGIRRGLVTGKGMGSTLISLRILGLEDRFEDIGAGSIDGVVKAQAIRQICDRWRLEPAQVAYVGDSRSDIREARKAGAVPVGAAWAPNADVAALVAADPVAVFTEVDELIAAVRGTAAWSISRGDSPQPPGRAPGDPR